MQQTNIKRDSIRIIVHLKIYLLQQNNKLHLITYKIIILLGVKYKCYLNVYIYNKS